ncbi:hypothetical protein LINGRAHAP2_LOCUS12080, partial [Linum grandiflorum]
MELAMPLEIMASPTTCPRAAHSVVRETLLNVSQTVLRPISQFGSILRLSVLDILISPVGSYLCQKKK